MIHSILKILIFCLPLALLNAQETPKKLLAIFAHPDDEQSVAPLLVKSLQEGVEVTLVIATDGRLGVNQYTDYVAGDELASLRRQEMRCAAEVLGVKLIHLNYHDQLKAAEGFDGHVPHAQSLILELKEIVLKEQPDAIITWGPDGVTTHMDHRLVGASATQVYLSTPFEKPVDLYYFATPSDLLPTERSKTLRGQEKRFLTVQIPFTSQQYDQAYQALLCHQSQYPSEVVLKMKEDRKQFGNILYLRQLATPSEVKTSLF